MIRIVGVLMLLIIERFISYSSNFNLWMWIGLQSFLFLLIPLIFIHIHGIKRDEVGLTFSDSLGIKYALAMVLLALPFMMYGAMLPSFKLYYPIWGPARTSVFAFLLLESAVFIMMFSTEFFFRGLLLFSIERATVGIERGRWVAIVAHSIVYMLVHLGKPGLEVPYSFFVGIAFGWLALKTRSIMPSVIAHWTSSVIFDILAIVV